MKYQFQDIIIQVEVNEIYKTEKFFQMVIEYPELTQKKSESRIPEQSSIKN
jgi:hypothetical protein